MLREQLAQVEEQKAKGVDMIKNMDCAKIRMMEETEMRHKQRQQELEREIEEKSREFEENIKEV